MRRARRQKAEFRRPTVPEILAAILIQVRAVKSQAASIFPFRARRIRMCVLERDGPSTASGWIRSSRRCILLCDCDFFGLICEIVKVTATLARAYPLSRSRSCAKPFHISTIVNDYRPTRSSWSTVAYLQRRRLTQTNSGCTMETAGDDTSIHWGRAVHIIRNQPALTLSDDSRVHFCAAPRSC